jgi:SARP family transcriptional regulator, regulator of embCAB operon
VEFRVLGSVGLVDDGRVKALRGSQQRILLALLAIQAGDVVTKVQLFDELWGEEAPSGADNALQALVTRFRRTLRDFFGEQSARDCLVTMPAGYTLNIDPMCVDVHAFDRLAAQARTKLPADPAGAHELLDRALALWQGPALQGVAGGPICHSAAAQFEEARLAAVQDRIRVAIAIGGHAAVISELKMLAMRYPWRERFFELLMVCLYRAGRQAEAVQTYNHVRRRLVDELGMEPSPGLKRCLSAILKQDPALGLDR